MILFFSKSRIDSKETKLYGFMLISSFFDIILVLAELIITYYFLDDVNMYLVKGLNKIDFIPVNPQAVNRIRSNLFFLLYPAAHCQMSAPVLPFLQYPKENISFYHPLKEHHTPPGKSALYNR